MWHVVALWWVVFGAQYATANTVQVTTLADTGPGSLREAISAVNSQCDPSGNAILFGSVSGTIVISSELPPLSCAHTEVDGTSAPDINLGSMIPSGMTVGSLDAGFPQTPRPDVAIVSLLNTGHGVGAVGTVIS